MNPTAFYNEFDAFPAQWLRNLIGAGEIMKGTVDERSIAEVRPEDVRGYTRCHWFAGLGAWDLACQLAGWGDRSIWTASLPCQPWSSAGKRRGGADDRNLWPHFYRLVRDCRPDTIVGEQVPAAISLGWIDGIFSDQAAQANCEQSEIA